MVKVRLVRSRGTPARGRPARSRAAAACSGELEEYFIEGLMPGDTFVFARRNFALRNAGRRRSLCVARACEDPKVPAYMGGKFPLSTYLAAAGARR